MSYEYIFMHFALEGLIFNFLKCFFMNVFLLNNLLENEINFSFVMIRLPFESAHFECGSSV